MRWLKIFFVSLITFVITCLFQGCSRMKPIQGSTHYYLEGDKVVYSPNANVFTRGKSIVYGADVKSFVPLSNCYAKDKNHIYWGPLIIKDADISSITLLKESVTGDWSCYYIKDKNHIFYKTDILKEADLDTFEVESVTDARDKNYYYNVGKIDRRRD